MPKKESGTRKQDYVIQLVSSLNAAEKRYFKLNTAQQKGDKKYSRLFDEIAQLDQYDADKLSRKLKVTKKQLADDKNYLQSILLDSVKNFDTSRNQWHHAVLEGMALFDRGLYHYALDHLDGVIAAAEREELWPVLQSALHYKAGCMVRAGVTDLESYRQLHMQFTEVLDRAREQEDLRHLSQTFSMVTNGINLDTVDTSYRQHPLYRADYTDLRSVRAQIYWFTLHLADAMILTFDHVEALRLARAQAAHFGQDGRLLLINPGAYYAMIVYWANAEENAGDTLKAISILARMLQDIDALPRSEQSGGIISHYRNHARHILSHLYLNAGDYTRAVSMFDAVYKEQKAYNEPNQIDILHFYALSLIYAGHASRAHDILEELLTRNSKTREDLYVSARALMLLVQYDLGNHDVLLHNIVSTKSFFARHKVEDKRFGIFLKYFTQLVKAADKKKALLVLQDEIMRSPASRDVIPFPRRELLHWVEQKLGHKKKGSPHT